MTITIDSQDPRSVAALELMTQAGQWGKAHLRDGQKFYAVPSRTHWPSGCTWRGSRPSGRRAPPPRPSAGSSRPGSPR